MSDWRKLLERVPGKERFELQGDPADEDVGLVAFSATSLFNILYKNGVDVDSVTHAR